MKRSTFATRVSTGDETAVRQEQLGHVYWIGGGSAAGKSTIARRIAAAHNLVLYSTDETMSDHARRITASDCPFLHQFMTMDMDERWLNRSPTVMFETFHWFKGEGFSLIVDDLLRLPGNSGVLVEGFRLLPMLVNPFLAQPERAVWLLPSPDFRQAVFDSRGGSAWRFLGKTSEPEKALSNLLERDRMFTDQLRAETQNLSLHTIEVISSMTEDDLAERVTEAFGL